MSSWYRWHGDDLVLSVRVQPRASRDELAAPLADALKVRITAPPVDGKANAHLAAFLAKTFGVAKSDVVLESGESSRIKRLRVRKPRQLPKIITPV
jgi:uncharacterized protein (TIGR00251 family)